MRSTTAVRQQGAEARQAQQAVARVTSDAALNAEMMARDIEKDAQQHGAEARAQARELGDQIREQVRNSIQDAQRAADEAGRAVASDGTQAISVERDGAVQRIIVRESNGTTHIIEVGPDGIISNGQHLADAPMDFRNVVPSGAVDMVMFISFALVAMVVGFPLARAFGRWLDRRGNTPPIPAEVTARLANIEQAVDAVAVEVERISEGQRFTSRLLADRAQPVAVGERL